MIDSWTAHKIWDGRELVTDKPRKGVETVLCKCCEWRTKLKTEMPCVMCKHNPDLVEAFSKKKDCSECPREGEDTCPGQRAGRCYGKWKE